MRIIHLFADLCNLYGDYGNVCGLKRALENKGQNVEVEYQSIDDEIDIRVRISCLSVLLPRGIRK